MMISPETYYEVNIKGKTREEILRKIAALKREISHLKFTMEHPEYTVKRYPSEDTILWCTRMYLERTIQALADMGQPYEPTLQEKRVIAFDYNIDNIKRVTFKIGGFFSPWRTYTVHLDDQVVFETEYTIMPPLEELSKDDEEEIIREDFLSELRELHLGEWRRHYNLTRYGYFVCDGTQWELIIEYNNGRKAESFSGDNAYPYNFNNLLELMHVDVEEFCDEDEEDEEEE